MEGGGTQQPRETGLGVVKGGWLGRGLGEAKELKAKLGQWDLGTRSSFSGHIWRGQAG